MNMSPDQIAAAAKTLKDSNEKTTVTESNSSKLKEEELLALVNQMISSMKGNN